MQQTILVIGSNHLGWAGIRAMLEQWSHIQVVGDVQQSEQALSITSERQPDVIFTAPRSEGVSIATLILELRTCSPSSRIIVLGDLLPQEELVALVGVGVVGYVLWKDLDSETLAYLLQVVQRTDLFVSSNAVLGLLRETLQQDSCHNRDTVVLKPREQAVLQDLAEGFTQLQIASAEHMSERTVRRIICMLEERLDAPSAFVLGMKAERLGLIAFPNLAREEAFPYSR